MSLYTGLQLPADQKLAGLIVMSGMPQIISYGPCYALAFIYCCFAEVCICIYLRFFDRMYTYMRFAIAFVL